VSAELALRELLDDARDSVAPAIACVVAAGDPGGPRFVYAQGFTHDEDDAPAVNEHTAFDLASLTKILSTTLLCAYAVETDRLRLDEEPWPGWPGVSVRHVLLHNGGLVWWAPFFERVEPRDVGTPAGARAVTSEVLSTELARAVGSETVYSDLGFIALTALLEERLGDRYDRLFDAVAKESYGETGLRYVPIFEQGYHPALPDVAATERCAWRRRLVHGQANDGNCFAMGGIAGHAGLFGSVLDVESAARYPLALPARTASFATWDGERRIGYDRPTEGGTTGGAVSDRGFGHLGFTGTSVWLDPDGPAEGGALYVLLTNRVCPTTDNDRIKQFRPAFHRAGRAWLEAQR
jgi:CubicO group peptidase (beta-lactamase class C family)